MLESLKFSAGHEKFSGVYRLTDIQRSNQPVWKLVAYLDVVDMKLHPVTYIIPTFVAYEQSIGAWTIFRGGPKLNALCAGVASARPQQVPKEMWAMHVGVKETPRTGNAEIDRIVSVAQGTSLAFPCDSAEVTPLTQNEIERLHNVEQVVGHFEASPMRLAREDLVYLSQPFPRLRKVQPMTFPTLAELQRIGPGR